MEVADRLGESLLWWLEQPYVFVLYMYYNLQELDRRKHWSDKLERIEGAWLSALGFHQPDRLIHEHTAHMRIAAFKDDADAEIMARGLRMIADMERGKVMEDMTGNLPPEVYNGA